MAQYEPSALGLALLDSICDTSTKDEAIALMRETGALARTMITDITEKYGNRSLYVMQSIGELMIATVQGTLEKMAESEQ